MWTWLVVVPGAWLACSLLVGTLIGRSIAMANGSRRVPSAPTDQASALSQALPHDRTLVIAGP